MTFFSEKMEDSFGELGGRSGKAKEGMDVPSLIRSWGRGGAITQVERESERLTDSRDIMDNTSTINGAATPSVSSSVRSLNE